MALDGGFKVDEFQPEGGFLLQRQIDETYTSIFIKLSLSEGFHSLFFRRDSEVNY
jgi:hypothetical protein